MTTDAENLVDAEQAVQDLLSELAALRAETEHYSSGAKSLLEAREDLRDLCTRTGELAASAHESVAAVKDIGTPLLLKRLDDVTALCQQTQRVSTVANETASSTSGHVEILTETTERLVETCISQYENTRRRLDITTILLCVTLVTGVIALGLQISAVRGLVGMP